MLTIIAFIIAIGILVTVHEYGHYQVAKWCGVKVIKFSIGFGKPIWSKKFGKDQTEFVIATIPLGGYVKMLGEELVAAEPSAKEDMSRALNHQSVQKRMAIVLAGPAANLLLAIFLYSFLFMLGTVGLKPIVGEVVPNSPATASGIKAGVTIIKVDSQAVSTWQDVRWFLLNQSLKNSKVTLEVSNRDNQISLHEFDVSTLNQDNVDTDILEKLGLTIYQPPVPARIGQIAERSPAAYAGLEVGDLILSVNQQQVIDWESFVTLIKNHPNKTLKLKILRANKVVNLNITPELVNEKGMRFGRIGAGFKLEQTQLAKFLVSKRYGLFDAVVKSVEKTWETSIFSLKMLGNMLLGNISWKGMSGPVTIASYAGQSANMGFKVYIGFLALVSISIGVLNLLPIPILDGGHFMYYMVEFFTGKPASEFAINLGQKIGFVVLIFTMLLALYNDLNRLITG
jgi:regulator of sigma E protease